MSQPRAPWVVVVLDLLSRQRTAEGDYRWIPFEVALAEGMRLVPPGLAARRMVSGHRPDPPDDDGYPSWIARGQRRVARHAIIRSAHVEINEDMTLIRYREASKRNIA